MANPRKPEIGYDYSGFAGIGPHLEDDFAALKYSADQTIDALADIRRADGKLNNRIVTKDSLADDVLVGDPGSSDVVGTSASLLAIATGTKTFTIVEPDRGWGVGARLRASSALTPANWMEGIVTAYADDSLMLSVDITGGSGTKADWTINLAGEPWFASEGVDAGKIVQYIPTTPGDVFRLAASRGASPRTYTLSSVSDTTLTLTTTDQAAIITVYMVGLRAVRIWNTTKSPAEPAWVSNIVADTHNIIVTDAADIASWSTGDTLQLGDPNPTGDNVLGMIAVDISGYLQSVMGSVFRQKGLMLASYVSGDGPAAQDYSGTAATGSAFGGNALSDGTRNQMTIPIITPTLSPISNSNLLFVREALAGSATALSTAFVRVLGVYA